MKNLNKKYAVYQQADNAHTSDSEISHDEAQFALVVESEVQKFQNNEQDDPFFAQYTKESLAKVEDVTISLLQNIDQNIKENLISPKLYVSNLDEKEDFQEDLAGESDDAKHFEDYSEYEEGFNDLDQEDLYSEYEDTFSHEVENFDITPAMAISGNYKEYLNKDAQKRQLEKDLEREEHKKSLELELKNKQALQKLEETFQSLEKHFSGVNQEAQAPITHPKATTPWEELEFGEKAWEDFSHKAREEIVRHYAPKIRFIASRMKAKLPRHIELNELISVGTIGLLEALGKFQPQFSIRFDSYAESRIRGAMIDELRRLDWFPRSLRARVRDINQAIWRVESEEGRTPTTEEISQMTGLSHKEINIGLEAVQNQLCVSLEAIQDCVAGESGMNDEEDPYKNAVFLELVNKISSIIEILTPREKLVLSLYYNDELNMREASEVMDITEGRVSQLHTQAIARLRKIFAEQFGDSL